MSLSKQKIVGWKLRESEYEEEVGKYLARLDLIQRESFAPLSKMIENSLEGFDLHVMTMVNEDDTPCADNINGLVIFNQEANQFKNAAGTSSLKVSLHHVSSLYIEQRDAVFDLALEYIWKHTHCSAIRLNLYHIKNKETGQIKADPDIKAFLKR